MYPAFNTIIKLIPKKEAEKPKQEEINNLNKDLICDFYEKYKISKLYTFNDFGNLIYNFLNKLKLINLSKIVRRAFLTIFNKFFIIFLNKHANKSIAVSTAALVLDC